ncbi:unnamed protein product [Effrenium voratum]|uniref:Uncharacterized protein n=1 Tax=Effrenium voratum TaxID=2562239 RepID=A0AA36IAQ5_9DINO|nr:unnamed protein product [Effrenium voratum]
MFLLQNCEAFLQEQRLFLRLGRGRLVRDGFLALLFKEAPNLSTSVWTPQEPQGQGQSQGNRCFLCSAEDHSVLDCEFLPCGVVIKSPQMEELDRQQRRARLEEALEKENFGPPEAVRWYKKETSGSGLLYVRLASPELAHELLQQEVLDIGGEPANVYPITKGKPAPKVKANPAKAKIARRKLAKVQAAAATLAPCQVKDGTAPPRPCLLCDDKEHQAHRCPFWRQCVTIKGAEERDRDALLKTLGL